MTRRATAGDAGGDRVNLDVIGVVVAVVVLTWLLWFVWNVVRGHAQPRLAGGARGSAGPSWSRSSWSAPARTGS